MIFDRILEDILGFIRRFLWWQECSDTCQRKPFTSLQRIEGMMGVISLVDGRDTPRAVRSWIYAPKRLDLNSTRMIVNDPAKDLHLYLDFLGPLPGVSSARSQEESLQRKQLRHQGQRVPTHRLQILKASHHLNQHGFYDYELVFWQDYDFYLPITLAPDRLARILADKLAHACLDLPDPLALEASNWEDLIHSIWQEVRGRSLVV